MENLTRKATDKPSLPIKVIQFGSGNFLRGFVEYIIDELNDYGYNAGIAVIKNRPGLSMLDLQNQEGAFTLFTEGVKKSNTYQDRRLITCISKVVNPYDRYEDYLNLASEPELKLIVSNTTEAGIHFDSTDANLADGPHSSFAAKLTTLLYRRFKLYQGDPEKGVNVLPCELIENNGKVLLDIVLQYAALWQLEEGFKNWLCTSSKFYNTLVDRIVSGYPKDNAAKYLDQLEYNDKLITICEPYLFWAIEGDSSLVDQVPFHHFGEEIIVVDDLSPYRLRKVRILNGAHTLMAQIGRLKSLETVGDCMQDKFTSDFILKAITEEIIPTMPMSKSQMDQYAAEVFDRFRNPYLRHYLGDIAQNTTLKFKTRLLPAIVDYVAVYNTYPKHLIFALAALIYLGKEEWNTWLMSTTSTPDIDNTTATAAVVNYDDVVLSFVTKNDFTDHTLNNDNFVIPLRKALELIDNDGLELGYSRF